LTGAVVRYSGISRLVRAGTLAWPMESWMKASLTARIAAGMVRARRTSASVMYLNWVLGSMVVTSVPILPDTRNDSNGFRRAGGDPAGVGHRHGGDLEKARRQQNPPPGRPAPAGDGGFRDHPAAADDHRQLPNRVRHPELLRDHRLA